MNKEGRMRGYNTRSPEKKRETITGSPPTPLQLPSPGSAQTVKRPLAHAFLSMQQLSPHAAEQVVPPI